MPATAIIAQELPGPYSQVGAELTWATIDHTNGNSVVASALQVLLVRNATGSSKTVTITSQPDPVYGRTGNANATLADGVTQIFQLTGQGWANSSGNIEFTGQSGLSIAVIKVA